MKHISNGFAVPTFWGTARGVLVGAGTAIACLPGVAQAAAAGAAWSATADQPLGIEVVAPVSAPMAFAASELARYLGRILGRPIAVGTAAPGRPRILIEKVVDSAPMGDESYEIRAEGNTLRLRAGGDPGAVFGVYEFLRRYGGCRFSGLGPDGELVPTAQRVTADGLPLRMRPKLWYRAPNFFRRGARTEWRGRYTDEESTRLCVEWLDWLVKNGLNYLMYTRDIDEEWFARAMLPEVRKRGVKLDFDNHNLRRWLPPERYFADHPEWFPMVDGKRVARCEQLSMCTSNQGAVQAVIENVKAFLRAHPEMSVVGVMPEDGHGMCHCDACTRLDVANGIDPQEQYRKVAFAQEGKGNRALRRRYTLLVNQVARAVREEFPDVLIASAGYVDLTAPDPEIPLESNTVVWIALFGCDGARPISAESPSKVNRLFYNTMEQWLTRTRGKVVAFSYTMGMSTQCSLPYSMDRVLVDVWKNLKALGIQGAGMHQRPEDHEVYALNVLAVLRSAWQDDVDPDALLDEYLEGMYGS
ncbi:MAG: DUF4838 domain-containing protein, partial [Armatimonadetes bacterium]|nr:DUF4838 domain-containing protein [Armatimonadota bacterium]